MVPPVLKIGGIDYTYTEAESWFESDGSDGEVFYDKQNGNKIFVNSRLSEGAMGVSLLHEALHCMNSTLDHVALDSLAEQLYQFLHDNHLTF